jgi:hypothetical protein
MEHRETVLVRDRFERKESGGRHGVDGREGVSGRRIFIPLERETLLCF